MKHTIATIGLAAILVAGGCDAVDYYPNHEGPQQASDLRKDGAGSYGGNNSSYPVGTPGTAGAATQSRASDPGSGPTFNTNGQGSFSTTGSYSGANTGGSTAGSSNDTVANGAGQAGTAAGH